MNRATQQVAKHGQRMAEVKKMRDKGISVRQIAAYLGISRQAVYQTLARIRGRAPEKQ